MFDLQKFNDLLGTNFASIDEITDHQLLAALVTLTAASLGVSIFVCNPTTGAGDGLRAPTVIKDFPMRDAYPEGHQPKRRP